MTEKPQEKTLDSQQKKTSNTTAIFAIIFALAALGACVLTWYQLLIVNLQKENQLILNINDINSDVKRMTDIVSQVKTRSDNTVQSKELTQLQEKLYARINQTHAKTQEKQTRLAENIQKLQENLHNKRDNFALEEAKYLLRLANHNSTHNANLTLSINALQSASAILKNLNNPQFFKARQQIQKELQQLKEVPVLETQQIDTTLTHISQKIHILALANEPEIIAKEKKNLKNAQKNASWKDEFQTLWSEIKGTISIRNIAHPPKPLLSPNSRFFLNENLRLTLNQASLALHQRNQLTFNVKIQQSLQWINTYFDTKNTEVKIIIKQLEQIKDKNIQQKIPDISASYQLLLTTQN